METKIITTSFDDRADVHWPTATLQCELESIEDAFRDCNSELSGAEMPPLTYSFQADAISEMTENMMKLQVYAGTAREQIYLELDNPLYQHFKDNATETLSQIILDEITTDNTIGMEEYYEVAGKGKVYGRTRVKKNLTMRDFLGLQEITPESGMPVLENVETIGEFASMFRKDYDIMTSMYVDVNACIEAYMTSGEYNHHAYHPIGDMLSGVLDITVIKPIIECFTGTDLITGERLTETEKAWKAVGAAIDAITFGQGTTALKGVKLFSTEAFETIGRTFMWDLVSESAAYGINYAGQQIGMPEGFNWILTAATGMTVSMAGDKFILEGVDGTKIKKSFKEMKEWLVEKLRKSESGTYSAFGHMSEIDGLRYRDWNYGKINEMSIHNPDSNTLTLGKFRPSKNIDGTDNWKVAGSDSYNVIAEKNGDMYFDMKDGLYDEVMKNYNLSYQDMFDEFNTTALDKAISEGKIIRFSHNPELAEYAGSFIDQEWKYLQKKGDYLYLREEGGFWYAEK